GSLESKQTLTSSQIDVVYYDSDGKTVLYKQHLKQSGGAWVIWEAEDSPKDGSSRDIIFDISHDKETRLASDTRHNFTLNGVGYD
ncbi:hypothetical protein ABTJ99_20725, partial [Acinetobacter baumannii]